MAQSNAAIAIPAYSNDNQQFTDKNEHLHPLIKKLNLSSFEKMIIVTGSLVVFTCLLGIVYSKIQLGNAQTMLTIERNNVTEISNKNEILNEEKAELSSHDRLIKYAQSHNLSLNNNQIKHIN